MSYSGTVSNRRSKEITTQPILMLLLMVSIAYGQVSIIYRENAGAQLIDLYYSPGYNR